MDEVHGSVRWYRPTAVVAAERPTLLWLHGGGFFRGSPSQPEADSVASALADRGVTVATAGYRLAPIPGLGLLPRRAGHPRGRFPAALDDIMDAYRTVRLQSPGGVILGGASAGACLAAAATLRAMDEGAAPVGTVFVYGFFHAAHPRVHDALQRSRGHRRFSHAPWALDVANRNYAVSASALADRLAFPGGHAIDRFPRTLLINAERDNMRASGDAFARELGAAGVDVQEQTLPGTSHAFLNRPGTAAFAAAVSLIAEWF